MKNLTKFIKLVALALFPAFYMQGQNVDCAFDEDNTFLQDSTSRDYKNLKAYDLAYSEFIKSGQRSSAFAGQFDHLPIVVHILHTGDSLGSISNPRDETIMEAIQLANDYFRQTNDQQNTFDNPHYGADTGIGFCLASRDAKGRPSAGIIRHYMPESSGSFFVGFSNLAWDREKYINVVISDRLPRGACGSFSVNENLIRINYGCVNSSTLAHELGHYFSLAHTFRGIDDCANNDCTLDGDKVCDTPPKYNTRNSLQNAAYTCALPGNSCTSDEDDTSKHNPYRSVNLGGMGDQADVYSNLMGYTRACRNNFTQGQAARMQFNLLNERSELWSQESHCNSSFNPVNDAGINKIIVNPTDDCNQKVNIEVLLVNRGSQILSTADVVLFRDGVLAETINWQGVLAPGEQEKVVFENLSIKLSNNHFHVQSQNPNNEIDEDLSSDDNFVRFTNFGVQSKFNTLNSDVTLDCNEHLVKIGIEGLESTPDLYFLWRRENGLVADSLQNRPLIIVDTADTYFFTIYNEKHTCAWYDTIVVSRADADFTNLSIEFDKTVITCANPFALLRAVSPSFTSISWYSREGKVKDGRLFFTNVPNDYRFEALDTKSNCSAYSDWIRITDLREYPKLELIAEEITCAKDTIIIDASKFLHDSSRYEYTWKDLTYLSSSGSSQSDFVPELEPIDGRYLPVSNPGTYSLRVVDKHTSCSTESRVDVLKEKEVPLIDIRGLKIFKNETRIRLNAINSSTGDNFAYQWTTHGGDILEDDTTLKPLIEGNGSYALTIVNKLTNCSATKTINLFPEHVISARTLCPGFFSFIENFEILLTINGKSDFDLKGVEWLDKDGDLLMRGETFRAIEPGVYTAKYFNGLDTIREEVALIKEDFQETQAIIEDVLPITCDGENIILWGSSSIAGPHAVYIWRNDKNEIISGEIYTEVDTIGKYVLEIVDLNSGCFSTAQVHVNIDEKIIQADAGIDKSLNCAIQEVTLGENQLEEGYEYIWSQITETGLLPMANMPQFTTSNAGDFILQVHNLNTDCITIDSVTVKNVSEDIDIAVELSGGGQYCGDSTIVLSVVDIGDYFDYKTMWTLPNGEQSDRLKFSAHEEGTYVLNFLSNQSSCASTDTFDYKRPEQLGMFVNNIDDVSCYGEEDGSISVKGQGGYPPYILDMGSFEAENLKGGQYDFILLDSSGCMLQKQIEVNQPAQLEIKNFKNFFTGLSLEVKGGNLPYKYLWSTGEITSDIENLVSGNSYTVTITDSSNCSISGSAIYKRQILQGELIIQPNPSEGIFVIKHLDILGENMKIQVYDAAGQLISNLAPTTVQQEAQVDLSAYPAGIYFLGIEINGQVYYRRVVIL